MISLLFALDHEAALVRGALTSSDSFRFSHLTCVVGAYGRQEVSLGIVGMGGDLARDQTAVFLQYFRPRLIILAGYAGALIPEIGHGEVFLAENYARPSTFQLPAGLQARSLVSVSQVVGTRSGREALRMRSGTAMVDMETASVASEISRHQIPFIPLRGISDTLGDDLPQQALASAFDSSTQKATPGRMMAHFLQHPREIPPFVRFVSGLNTVRSNLTRIVLETVRLNSLDRR